MGSFPGPETKIPHAVGQVSPLAANTEPKHHSYRKITHHNEDPTGLRWDPTKPKKETKKEPGGHREDMGGPEQEKVAWLDLCSWRVCGYSEKLVCRRLRENRRAARRRLQQQLRWKTMGTRTKPAARQTGRNGASEMVEWGSSAWIQA